MNGSPLSQRSEKCDTWSLGLVKMGLRQNFQQMVFLNQTAYIGVIKIVVRTQPCEEKKG